MFHLHPMPPPFAIFFHFAGAILLFVALAVLARAFFRARCRRRAGELSTRDASIRRGSGNRAFDDYRRATVRKLELEADEFRKYLDGLRRAADASAFDAFLKSRRAEGGPAM